MNFDRLEKHRIELSKPLLILKGEQGLLACGYLNIETFNKTGEACAIVTGVNSYDEMLAAPVVSASSTAIARGVVVGETGAEALQKMEPPQAG